MRAVLLDFGDTLVDESTERKERGVTVAADFLPGAIEVLDELRADYRLGLVADGLHRSYVNVLGHAGVIGWFASVVSSERVGVEKPAPEPFLRCLEELAVPHEAFGQVVMVGNRLDRDVGGAKPLGIRSVWLRWSPRYPLEPKPGDPVPDATIGSLHELPRVTERLGRSLRPD